MRKLSLVTLLCSSAVLMRADFTYTETTQLTGGSMAAMMQSLGPLAGRAREPRVSIHILKGNRMATITKEGATIVDLDKETITTIENNKKQYTVTTFAELKQRMEQGAQAVQSRQKGPSGEDVQTNYKVSAKATGQTRTIQGLSTKEMVVNITTEMTDKSGQTMAVDFVTDSWIGQPPGYDEVREFYKKMGAQVGSLASGMQLFSQMPANQPGMTKGMEEMAKEMQKLDGIPVESITKMGGSGDQSAAAPAPTGNTGSCSADSPSQQQSSPAAAALSGAFGKFGGFGKKKDDRSAPAQSGCAPSAGGGSSSGSFMETTTSLSSFSSSPVDASKIEVPPGFKQVENRR